MRLSSLFLTVGVALAGCTSAPTYDNHVQPDSFFLSYAYIDDVVARNDNGFALIETGRLTVARKEFLSAAALLSEGVETHQSILDRESGNKRTAALKVFTDIDTDSYRVPVLSSHPIAQAVVKVETGEGSCTGFFIKPNVVATAAHCLDHGDPVSVLIQNVANPEQLVKGVPRKLRVLQIAHPERTATTQPCDDDDFGFLKVNYRSPHVLPVAEGRKLSGGDPLMNLGFPGNLDNAFFLRMDVGCRVQWSGPFGFFQSNCSAGPGQSGGPTLVLDEVDGQANWGVVGIMSCGRRGGTSRGQGGAGQASMTRATQWYRQNVSW